ncbi:hypothetical protein JCM5350_001317 [Sporobolomyces pararoseus]
MKFLPKVGTLYSSIDELKLDVLQRIVKQGWNFGTRASTYERIDFRCSYKTKLGGICSSKVIAKCKAGEDKFKVIEVEERHNCRSPPEQGRQRRRTVQEKIEVLKEKLKRERSLKKDEWRQSDSGKRKRCESSESEDSDDSTGTQDDEESSYRQSRGRNVKENTNEISSEEEDEEESEGESSDSRGKGRVVSANGSGTSRGKVAGRRQKEAMLQKKRFPAARDCKIEISRLLFRGPVNLPTPDDVFDTSRKLFVHLYAYAEQRGFSIYRRSPIEEKSWIRVTCYRSHSRWSESKNGKCGFAIEGRKMEDGKWRVDRVNTEHNHSIKDGDSDRDSEEESSSSSGEETQERQPRTSRKLLRQNSAPSPSASLHARPDTFVVPSRPYRPRLNAKRPPTRRLKPSTPSSNPSDLSLLVKSFLPPSSPRLSATLLSLNTLGISNVETLTSILMMGKSRFTRFVGKIGVSETRHLLVAIKKDSEDSVLR